MSDTQPDQPEDIERADTPIGGNPHTRKTGERQAEENRENDPPA